jgi:hypothetical protein
LLENEADLAALTAANGTLVIPASVTAGRYEFQLEVMDECGESSTSSTVVNIILPNEGANLDPVSSFAVAPNSVSVGALARGTPMSIADLNAPKPPVSSQMRPVQPQTLSPTPMFADFRELSLPEGLIIGALVIAMLLAVGLLGVYAGQRVCSGKRQAAPRIVQVAPAAQQALHLPVVSEKLAEEGSQLAVPQDWAPQGRSV